MKFYKSIFLSAFIATGISTTSCSEEDDGYNDPNPDDPQVTILNSKSYDLDEVGDSDVSGTATFIEYSDSTLAVELDLQNTIANDSHPAHIHENTAAEGGDIILSLEPVDGNTGKSETIFTALNNGTAITYEQLLDLNGYINIHLNADNLPTIVAQGDIGQNELTGNSLVYDLSEVDDSGVSGTISLAERVNQTTLVTIMLSGTVDGDSHPAHIHENDVATTGPVTVGLNPVDGATGVSKTQVSSIVGGDSISYDDFDTLDAYVNIHLSIDEIETLLAQGNIGSNVNDDDDDDNDGATSYDVTNAGASSYVFNGGDFQNTEDPTLTFKRGTTYTLNVNAPGHPFLIKSVQGAGTSNMYNDGVSNNGAVSGTITFTVPANAPDTLYYNCQFHGSMTGVINIVD